MSQSDPVAMMSAAIPKQVATEAETTADQAGGLRGGVLRGGLVGREV